MEHLIKNPVLGALLNCLAFGLADIYVGHFATGIFKLLFWLAFPVTSVYVLNYLSPFFPYDRLQTAWQWGWFLFLLVTGYRTVLKAIDEKTPSN